MGKINRQSNEHFQLHVFFFYLSLSLSAVQSILCWKLSIWNERLFINDCWARVLCVFSISSFNVCVFFLFYCKLLQTHPNSSHKMNLLKMDSHELYCPRALIQRFCCLLLAVASAITTHSPVNEWIHYMH